MEFNQQQTQRDDDEKEILMSNFADQQPNGTENDQVAIIGYGNFGNALTFRLKSVGIPVVVGTRRKAMHEKHYNTEFMEYNEACRHAKIVIMSVPASAYEELTPGLREVLSQKTVVDVSNAEKTSDECNAERLAKLLPDSYIVKAFNTISAWSMENDVYGASRNTFICGDHLTARHAVMRLARETGLSPVECGRLHAADGLEKKALTLFPEWRVAFWITFFMLVFQIIVLHGCYLIFGIKPSRLVKAMFMSFPNKIMGWMALWLLAVVYLPGCIAGFLQLYRGTKYSMFPKKLDAWMKARKQLGLFALMFALMHACFSCIALAGEYYGSMSKVEKISGTTQKLYHRYKWNVELSLLCATMSTILMSILGLTSLPTVNQSMSWREWNFVQSKLGYMSLLFGFLHILTYVYKSFSSFKPKMLLHPVFWMLLLPLIVMVLKLMLLLPGINSMLSKIRNGWERQTRKNMTIIA